MNLSLSGIIVQKGFILMNKLLSYYQKELIYLKQHGKLFSRRFPKIARRLGMSDGVSEDPHVERIVESFALLTARIHQRLDDDMPELTEALLTTLAPQFLRKIPSTCIVSIEPDRNACGITDKYTIAADSPLFTKNINDIICQFRTVYPIDLLPISLKYAKLFFDKNDLYWHLNIEFEVWSGARLQGKSLRLFLNGPHNAVNIMYTLILSEIEKIYISCEGKDILLKETDVLYVGFNKDDGLFKNDARIAPIHSILLEYFFFPEKFHFIDFNLPDNFILNANAIFELKLTFKRTYLNHSLEKIKNIIDSQFFRLNCTPAINLFPQRSEPVTILESIAEYPVIPDARAKKYIDVWAINHVFLQRREAEDIKIIPIQPLLGIDHSRMEGNGGIYWQGFQREDINVNGGGKKMFIAFSNHKIESVIPNADIVAINLKCTNDIYPNKMKNGHPQGDFDSDLQLAGLKINALSTPSRPVESPDKSALRWRLISQLSLNHLLLNDNNGADILRETLMLYNFQNNPEITRIINMIKRIDTQPIIDRLIANDPRSLARGVSLTVTFNHDALNEPEYYLFCSFIDHLLGLYAPVNSFSRVTTIIEYEEHTRRIWPVRSGRLSWI